MVRQRFTALSILRSLLPQPHGKRGAAKVWRLQLRLVAERGAAKVWRLQLRLAVNRLNKRGHPYYNDWPVPRSANAKTRQAMNVSGGQSGDSISSGLLWRVQDQQADAWERLAELVGPIIYRWCRRAGLQPDDAADVLQEVLTALHLHITRFRRQGPGDTFRGWLWTITRNKVRDHYRRTIQHPVTFGGSNAYQQFQQQADGKPAESLLDELADEADTLLTHRALERVRVGFEQRTWDAFWRATVECDAPADIAAEMGMSVEAVYQAKSRVLRRVRKELEGLV